MKCVSIPLFFSHHSTNIYLCPYLYPYLYLYLYPYIYPYHYTGCHFQTHGDHTAVDTTAHLLRVMNESGGRNKMLTGYRKSVSVRAFVL